MKNPIRGIFEISSLILRSFKAAPDVFISYRRNDAAANAELIHDRLVNAIGKSYVFLDNEDMHPGVDFKKTIEKRLSSSQVVLAVVGPEWLTVTDKEGHRRLADPGDFVRRELEGALTRGDDVQLIPVLVHGASMPTENELPASLAAFTNRSNHIIRDTHIDEDIGTLIASILRIPVDPSLKPQRFRRRKILAAVSITVLTFVAAWTEVGGFFELDARLENHILALADILQPASPSEKISLIGIKTKDGETFDKSWRPKHARLINTLANLGAEAIVFDISMDEPSDHDKALVDAVKAAQRNGTAVIIGTEKGISAKPALRDAFAGAGVLCVGGPRKLSYTTLVPVAVKSGETYFASITALSKLHGGKIEKIDFDQRQIFARDSKGDLQIIAFSRHEKLTDSPGCPPLREGDTVAQLIVRFSPLEVLRDPSRRLPYQAFFDGTSIPADRFKGKIVLVGRENDEEDIFTVNYRFKNERRPGFEVHADVLQTLLQGIAFRPLGQWGQLQVMVVMATLGQIPMLLTLFRFASFRRFYGLLILALYITVSVAVVIEYRILLNSFYHVSAFLLTYWASIRIARRLQLW